MFGKDFENSSVDDDLIPRTHTHQLLLYTRYLFNEIIMLLSNKWTFYYD